MTRVAPFLRPVLIVVLVLVLLLAALWLVQRRLIYFPDRTDLPPAGQVIPGARDVALETSDGLRLGAWLVPPPPGQTDRRTGVLVAPGNAGNRLDRVPLATALAREGLTVLLVDYRGYGGNPGGPSEGGLLRDVRAAQEYLTEQTDHVIYFGESLGAAVVTALAVDRKPAGLVLRSPFTDLPAVGRKHYPMLPVGLLARDRYPVADLIGRVKAPTVVVYGTADSIVPPAQSREVAERAAGPLTLVAVAGADHNDAALLDGDQIVAAVVGLADRIA